METVVPKDELGQPLRHCYWCKEFEAFTLCETQVGDLPRTQIWVCNSCLREWDPDQYLEQAPEISNDY